MRKMMMTVALSAVGACVAATADARHLDWSPQEQARNAPVHVGWGWRHEHAPQAHAKARTQVRAHNARHHPEAAPAARRTAPVSPPVKVATVAAAPAAMILEAAKASALGTLLGIDEAWADGMATAHPIVRYAPRYLAGTLEIGGIKMAYGSGGSGGAMSIPYGDFPITPGAIGPVGKRIGAVGVADGVIRDRRLHRERVGIELHALRGELRTLGCVAVKADRWGLLKRKLFAMLDEFGRAFLHVDPRGARISPRPEPMLILADLFAPKAAAPLDIRPRLAVVQHHHRAQRYAHHHRRVRFAHVHRHRWWRHRVASA